MSAVDSQLVCSGCQSKIPTDEVLGFCCPNRDMGDTDHVLRLQMSPDWLWGNWPTTPPRENDNPYLRYRRMSHAYYLATAGGLSDDEYVGIVQALSAAIAEVDAAPPRVTPLLDVPALGAWVTQVLPTNCARS